MWAFCAGMQRSGSTLQYQLVAEIVERKGVGRRVGFVEPEEFAALQKKHADEIELLVVKSHSFLPEAIQLCKLGQALVFCVHRDLRDIAVSLFNKNGTPIEVILQKRVLHRCVSEFQSWTDLPGTLVMRYDEMVANLSDSVLRIAQHLGIVLDKHECEKFANEFSHEKQRQRIQEFRCSLEVKGKSTGFDSNSLLHQNHIYSGETGQWRRVLTTNQANEIERIFGAWLEKHEYEVGVDSGKKSSVNSPVSWAKKIYSYLGRSTRNR